jgi:hypothetical protein
MAKQPPRAPLNGSRGPSGGRRLSEDPIALSLIHMVETMKEEPLPDELERLMAELATKLGDKAEGGGDA